MNSDKNSGKHNSNEPHSFMAWGCLAGAILGVGVGLFAGHAVFWAIVAGTVGLMAGAVIDRSRR